MSRICEHFAPGTYGALPGHKDTETSREAAAMIAPSVADRQEAVLAELRLGPGTADEVAGRLGKSILAVRPRLSELKILGKVEKTAARRKNASGQNAAVWRAK